MSRTTLIRLCAAIAVLTVVMAVPLTQIHWDGTQASTAAPKIDTLLNVMIILSSFVFAIVLVMLFYAIWKFRAKPGDESDGEPIHGNTRLEIAWTVIPTVIVLVGAVYSWIVLDQVEGRQPNALDVDVTGQQYEWTFTYPNAPGGQPVTSKELVVPVNRQLELHLTALDVIHSFWVPAWRIKRDAVPVGAHGNDVDNKVEVTPDRLGTYPVVCTELCGYGHATMRAFARVVPQSQFESWLAKQAKSQSGTTSTPSSAPVAGQGTSAKSTRPK
jgi:cytochrome c oxidase subunit 2